MTPRLLIAIIVLLVLAAVALPAPPAYALDIAPGTTSPSLQAIDCVSASGTIGGGICDLGCGSNCAASTNTAGARVFLSTLTVGRKFSETTVYTDFTVTTADNGAATSVDANVDYSVEWKGGWTLGGLFTGWNDAKSTVTLTLTDRSDGGRVVRSVEIHEQEPDGFVGVDIIDAGFGLDEGTAVNSMPATLVRGHTYRLGLTIHCEAKGRLNAVIDLDYMTGGWALWWNDLKVSIAPDLVEEIEKLKKRVEALENHTHTYLTGRGEGHNNTEAETSKPILVEVEDPSDEERKLLPKEDPAAAALPVRSVFLNNAPNPFNPSTTITYTLPEPLHVEIRLFDSQGRLARTLVSGARAAGPHALAFDGDGMASGVYYYRLTAGRFTETRKLTLVK